MKDGPALDEENDGQDAEEEQDPGGGEQVNAHAWKSQDWLNNDCV